MATNTYIALDKQTVASPVSSITFTGIDQTYTDLDIVANFDGSASSYVTMTFNGVTGTSYSRIRIIGNGASPTSDRTSNAAGIINLTYNNAGTPVLGKYSILNYSNTTTPKPVLCRDTNAADNTALTGGLFRGSTGSSTEAITSITITKGSGNFTTGSTFSLYGIRAEGTSPAPKATGGAIYSDSLYYYHVFASSGVFTPSTSLSCDTMIIAGGGGGGARVGGGGGAGGYRLLSGVSASATPYTITVGAGGAGQVYNVSAGTSGTNSTAIGNSSTGGGYGGNNSVNQNGGSGGSGGGANGNATLTGASGNAGGYSPVEGYAGGNSTFVPTSGGGGGGGGAGGAGTNGVSGVGGNGGPGVAVSSAWLSATGIGYNGFIAGGGGGGTESGYTPGTAGSGGAGTGSSSAIAATSALVNTGSGGGGGGCCSTNQNGGNGGSGIVIVRYLKA